MLTLAIISTVIVSIFILLMFGALVSDGFEETDNIILLILILPLIFIIISIWILYSN